MPLISMRATVPSICSPLRNGFGLHCAFAQLLHTGAGAFRGVKNMYVAPLIPIGSKFGRLKVIGPRVKNSKEFVYRCQCECGKELDVSRNYLANGLRKSCGCGRKKTITKLFTKHGSSRTRLYKIWHGILKRCNNPRSKSYPGYGGRGIGISSEFSDFVTFQKWATLNGYADHLTIDRKDNDGGYSPSNCRWATIKQQNRNSRHVRILTFNGVSKCVTEWSEIIGIAPNVLFRRLGLGWGIVKTLTTPVIKQ